MDGEPAILVPPAAKPRAAMTARATGVSYDKDSQVLTVKTTEGDVPVPADVPVYLNGVKRPAASAPVWFDAVATHRAKVESGNPKLVADGFKALAVPPVHFTLADTDDGPVARFDQRG